MSDGDVLRRSSFVVCYWKHGEFIFHNFATGERRGASAMACEVLGFFSEWKSLASLVQAMPLVDPEELRAFVKALVGARLLHGQGAPLLPCEIAMAEFEQWNPEAGFFHTATKNVEFASTDDLLRASQQPPPTPMPSVVKRYEGAPTIDLSPPAPVDPLTAALLGRRSWRRFGVGSVSLRDFSTLLGLSAGIQAWIDVPGQGKIAMKTSPSGGARHPVDLYVLAWNIDGLGGGLYHYAPDDHVLEVIDPARGPADVPKYLPGGEHWMDACAVLLFVATYARDLWRYPYSRAYRAPLVEVGHVAQTFCLLATNLGLAPFSAMALNDQAIENDLHLDGITESALFAAGVGVRPPGLAFAPTPPGCRIPELIANPKLRPGLST
jgi:SagB-type dehydrogenase family enzyme